MILLRKQRLIFFLIFKIILRFYFSRTDLRYTAQASISLHSNNLKKSKVPDFAPKSSMSLYTTEISGSLFKISSPRDIYSGLILLSASSGSMYWPLANFTALFLVLPCPEAADCKHAYHLYTIRVNKQSCGLSRDEFLNSMHRLNIGCGVHYIAIPQHPYYLETYKYAEKDFPNALRYGSETVSLPISPKLSDHDVCDVADAVREILS